MSHLDEGVIVAIRDEALVDADAKQHLGECPICQTALADALGRADLIGATLAALESPEETRAAKAAVRARLDAQREGAGRGRGRARRHLGRAAAVLLVAAGAAYAVPGSPMPGWLSETPEVAVVEEGPAVVTQDTSPEGGIEVTLPDGRIRVLLTGVRPESTLEIVWTDGATARISAAAGSSFSFGEGRAEAVVAPGPVRVELPRYAPVVSVEVDGRTYLRRSSASLEVLEPVADRSEDRIRFIVRER